MFVSKQVIEPLVIDLALKCEFERDGAHEFLYHLTAPGKSVPGYIAEILIEHPEITDTPSHLPERVAFGMVDDALCRFDLEMRKQRRLKFLRALNLVRLSLQQQEFPDIAITRSQQYHRQLVCAADSLDRLATQEVIFPAEAPTLVEQLLIAHLEIKAITELLLEIQIRRLPNRTRSRLKERVFDGLQNGMTAPIPNTSTVLSLDAPTGFCSELRRHEKLESASQELANFFSAMC